MKKNDKLLQKQNDRLLHLKELVRTYVESENRFTAMEEKTSKNDSENHQIFCKRNFIRNHLRRIASLT